MNNKNYYDTSKLQELARKAYLIKMDIARAESQRTWMIERNKANKIWIEMLLDDEPNPLDDFIKENWLSNLRKIEQCEDALDEYSDELDELVDEIQERLRYKSMSCEETEDMIKLLDEVIG